MIFDPKFTYQRLERVTAEDGTRVYQTPDGQKLPSVTTILGQTGDKSALLEWRKRVGNVEANRVSKEASGLGTLLHTHLEHYIMNEPRPEGTNLVRQMASNMADVVIELGLSKVSKVYGMEAPLYYPSLWAGTTDLIAEHAGEMAIVDYKTSKAIKKVEWIEDYFAQISAYALAHNKLFETNIKKCVIFMVSRDLKFQEFVIEGTSFQKYCNVWLSRVEQYMSQAK
jgi:hypothetical protein